MTATCASGSRSKRTEGVGISQGYTVLDLLATAQLLNRERDGSNASQSLA
jgi:hypothetical protein